MSQKKQIRRAIKGLSQDALNGLATPQAAGVFTATGEQSISPATLGLSEALVRGITPTNGNPGMVGSLMGGQSPYVVAAEAGGGLDLSRAAKKALRKALKQLRKNNGGDITPEQMQAIVGAARDAADVRSVGAATLPKYVRKASKDPVAVLSKVDSLAARLSEKQRNNSFAKNALTVAARNRRRAELVAAETGSVAKGVASLDTPELLSAVDDLERVLGITSSAAGFSPTRINADQQLRRIIGGGQSQTLRGTQAPGSVVGGPAAMLGQMLKTTGLGEEIARAEAAVRKAEQAGDAVALSRAGEQLTLLRLKAHHRALGMS